MSEGHYIGISVTLQYLSVLVAVSCLPDQSISYTAENIVKSGHATWSPGLINLQDCISRFFHGMAPFLKHTFEPFQQLGQNQNLGDSRSIPNDSDAA